MLLTLTVTPLTLAFLFLAARAAPVPVPHLKPIASRPNVDGFMRHTEDGMRFSVVSTPAPPDPTPDAVRPVPFTFTVPLSPR